MKQFIAIALSFFSLAVSAAIPETIVTGGNPSAYEKLAAEELRHFLTEISGKAPAVVREDEFDGNRAIYLGQTSFAGSGDGLEPEEWIIKTAGNHLVITGGKPVGTLYGVYAFLEKLGVAFLTPDATVIPEKPLALPVFDERKKPAFAGRLIYDGFPSFSERIGCGEEEKKSYARFALRSRINGSQSLRFPMEYIGKMFNLCHTPQWHTLGLYVDRSLFKTHPEYFPMDENGRRFAPLSRSIGANLCVSNPEVRRITLESLRAMIRKNRLEKPESEWSTVFDISVLDNAPFLCKCPECVRISAEENSECGLWLRYINEIAEKIAAEYPDITIRTLIYSAVKNPPSQTRPAANVLLFIADDFTRSDNFRPLTSKHNQHRLEYFRRWQEFNARMMIWDYWNLGNKFFSPPRVETMIDAIIADIAFFRELGVEALFFEAGQDRVIPQNFMALNYFVANRLMVDPDEDPEKLIAVFMHGYYGAAAPFLMKWFGQLRKSVAEYPNFQVFTAPSRWRHMTSPFIIETIQTLRAAEAAVPEESPQRERVRTEMIAPLAAIAVNRDGFEKDFKAAGIDIDGLVRDCRSFSTRQLAQYGGTKRKYQEDILEAKFRSIERNLPCPEKFSRLPREQVKLLAYPDFRTVRKLNSAIVDDPDSFYGKAIRSANPDPLYHGVDRLLPGPHKFKTTTFVLGNHRLPGRISLDIKEVPRDEKYHWYKIPGTLELREKSYFWGHGWAISAETSPFYRLTDGTPEDNMYECYFSAKFTGPAYVEGSTQPNAICLDAVVLLRPESIRDNMKENEK